jgi:hypothetical protein
MCAVPSVGGFFSFLMSSFQVCIQVYSEHAPIVTDITFDFAFHVSIFDVGDDDDIAHVELLLLLLLLLLYSTPTNYNFLKFSKYSKFSTSTSKHVIHSDISF